MSGLTFVPLAGLDVVGDDVQDFTALFADQGRMEHASAFLLVRRENWSEDPLYYVLGHEDLDELAQAVVERGLALEQLSREQLFQYLDVHEHTRAPLVAAGVEPGARAVVLDDSGHVEGVWADVQPELMLPPAPPPPGAVTGNGDEERTTRSAPPPFSVGGPPDDVGAGAERRGDEEPVVDAFWRRTPHMDLSEEEPLRAAQAFVACVYLNTEAASPDQEVRDVVLDLPDDLEIVDIEVMLIASEHFTIEGASLQTLSMHRDDEESPKLEFDLTVADAPRLDSQASLAAYLTYRERPCGLVRRPVALEGAVALKAADPEPVAEPAPELAIDARAEPADLTVQIVEGEEKDGRHYFVLLRTSLDDEFTMTEPEEWVFRVGTDTFVTSLMAEFTRKGATPFARQASLRGAGLELWQTAPECFRDLFWRLLDDGRPLRTIFVASAEPSIPWELMQPERELPNGELEQREALGVEFALGRWVHPDHRSPKQQDPIEDSYVVAPDYRVRKLATSSEEAKWVCDRFSGVAVSPAMQERLEELFAERAVGLVHFIAHGKSQPGEAQTLDLENDAVLTATQIPGGMPNLRSAFRSKAPLVFINACEVGRVTPTLVGAGGFARAFVDAGARGVVAPLWSVKDSLAHEVAILFYEAALKEPRRPFADILTDIRKRSYAKGGGEDSYAAYCWYGDPLTALEPST
jgi:CHAT domain